MCFTRKHISLVWSPLGYPLHTVHALFWKVHRQKETRPGSSQNAWRTTTPSWLHSHPLVYSTGFSFLPGLPPLTSSESTINLYCYCISLFPSLLSIIFRFTSTPLKKVIESSHTIFAHISSFYPCFFKWINNFTPSAHQDPLHFSLFITWCA